MNARKQSRVCGPPARLFLGFGVAYVSVSFAALAEPTSADKSLATQLFKEGRSLVDQGKYTEGCRKLEESQRLDPGGGTLLNLALCHEKEGRSATAWTEFVEALGIARKDDRPQRAEIAQQHIEALEPTLSRLTVHVPPASDLADLEIKRDGTSIRRAAWGTAMPIDPGEHVVEAFALGKLPWKQTVTVGGKAESKTITVPVLEHAPVAPTPPASTAAGQMPQTFVEVRRPINPAAWVAYGMGAAGLGVGSYFGIRAMSDQRTADDNCPLDRCQSQAGSSANANAIKSANIATVGFSVGVLGIGLGTFLLLSRGTTTVPSTASTSKWIAPRAMAFDVTAQQLSVSGAW
ncbi:MAG TPA: hypothetical protein VK540_01185 [Polyangiaceae bacterium]|nr:hypothetical protein [Polyangiaceae bacterium]